MALVYKRHSIAKSAEIMDDVALEMLRFLSINRGLCRSYAEVAPNEKDYFYLKNRKYSSPQHRVQLRVEREELFERHIPRMFIDCCNAAVEASFYDFKELSYFEFPVLVGSFFNTHDYISSFIVPHILVLYFAEISERSADDIKEIIFSTDYSSSSSSSDSEGISAWR